MISEQRAREIDHYFLRDSSARLKTIVISSVVGTLTFLILFWLDVGQAKAATISFLLMTLSFVVELIRYRAPASVRAPVARRQKSVDLAPSIDRRWILVRIPILAAFVAIFVIFKPRTTEGQAVGRRLLALKKQGRLAEARALYEKVVLKAGIPLEPSIATQVAVTTSLNSSAPPEDASAIIQKGQKLPLNLGYGEAVSIAVPVVEMPAGTYVITQPIQTSGVSFFGEGGDKTSMNFFAKSLQQVPEQILGQPALFQLGAYRLPVDSLYYGLSARMPELKSEMAIEFLAVSDAPFKVAVVNCEIRNFNQLLDLVTWIDVTFVACRIACSGRQFDLENVRFVNCTFLMTDEFPSNEAARIMSSSGRSVFMRYQP